MDSFSPGQNVNANCCNSNQVASYSQNGAFSKKFLQCTVCYFSCIGLAGWQFLLELSVP